MKHTSDGAGGSKCAKGLVLLAVLGLRVGDSRMKIAKRDDRYIKDASRTHRLFTNRRWLRKVMSDPATMPLVPRFGISPEPVWGQCPGCRLFAQVDCRHETRPIAFLDPAAFRGIDCRTRSRPFQPLRLHCGWLARSQSCSLYSPCVLLALAPRKCDCYEWRGYSLVSERRIAALQPKLQYFRGKICSLSSH
jgi:hypothetical protein